MWAGKASSSVGRGAPARKMTSTRRSWTTLEEQVLANSLKEIVVQGWKCDNGFKAGYLAVLEKSMQQAFPGTDLKADPHINSKIHVWKKNYGSLSTMLGRSGFGWNDAAHCLDVENDEVWSNYVKTDGNARTMRFKTWPLFKDWRDIFGKDRATGENAEAFVDVIQDLFSNGKTTSPEKTAENNPSMFNSPNTESHYNGVSHEESTATGSTKASSKKRNFTECKDDGLVDVMSKFCDKTDARLGDLVKCLSFEHNASTNRKAVFDAIGGMSFMSVEDQIFVSKQLCNNTKDLDLFFSLPEDKRVVMVSMLLNGKI